MPPAAAEMSELGIVYKRKVATDVSGSAVNNTTSFITSIECLCRHAYSFDMCCLCFVPSFVCSLYQSRFFVCEPSTQYRSVRLTFLFCFFKFQLSFAFQAICWSEMFPALTRLSSHILTVIPLRATAAF